MFIHYEIEPVSLQREVPYELDLFGGRAFVSLVAFTMNRLRPRVGGRLAELFFKPLATTRYLNVRTYVRQHNQVGIYFIAEFLSNPLCVPLGPPFLLERYIAFTCCGQKRRLFRIWHPPWPQTAAKVSVKDDGLLSTTGEWIRHARFAGANLSSGVHDVWMGWPQRIFNVSDRKVG